MAGEAPRDERPFTSWKDIAVYFGRDVRTVQRWEKHERLPIYRHPHRSRASVYAYERELEAWWRERRDLPVEGASGHAGQPEAHRRLRPIVALAGALGVVATVTGLWWSSLDRRAAAGASPSPRPAAWAEWAGPTAIDRGLSGDLNGDGHADLVLGASATSEAFVILGPGPDRPTRLPNRAAVHITTTGPAVLRVTHVGDVDGDGLADLLLSTYLTEPDTYFGSGDSYLVLGRRQWPATIVLPEDANVTFTMAGAGDTRVGGCPGSWSGDLNGDGIEDLVFGARDFTPGDRASAGATFLLFGRRTWARTLEISGAADVTIQGARAGEALGSFCSVGDFDGDGRPDLVVTAGESTLWNMLGARGRVYVIAGRASWPSVLDTREPGTFRLRIDGLAAQARDIEPLVGDLDGDGMSDLLLSWSNGATAGAIGSELTVWFGGPRGPGTIRRSDQADAVVPWTPRDAPSGAWALADLDTDGAADLVFAPPSGLAVLTLYGGPAWRDRAAARARQPVALARLEGPVAGWSIVGDLNGDDLPEFAAAAGAPRAPGTSARVEVVSLYTAVALDVRPERTPNVVMRPGVLVVRTPPAANGDAIDLPSTRLARAAPTRWAVQDFNQDGTIEAQVYFDTDTMRIDDDASEVILIARTHSGRLVAGRDRVSVLERVPASRPPGFEPPKGGPGVSPPVAADSRRQR